MNTEKTHARFWDAMRARFGKRWTDEFGPQPTAPWVQLLNQHTPGHLRDALDLMAEQKLAHPPTLPQFEALLKKASNRGPKEGVDELRNFWRSVVIGTCMRNSALLNIVPWGEANLGKLPPTVYEVAMAKCSELQEWACDAERTNGQRTPGLEQHINTELWNTLRPWARERGEFYTGHLTGRSGDVPRVTEQLTLGE
jgi:hypothetical protein